MIQDVDVATVVRTGAARPILWKAYGEKRFLGVHFKRGHIRIRRQLALPIVDGLTSSSAFEEAAAHKLAFMLSDPIRETGEISSAVFIPGAANYYHFLVNNLSALFLLRSWQGDHVTLVTSRGFPASARGLLAKIIPWFANGRPTEVRDAADGDYVIRDVPFRVRPGTAMIVEAARVIRELVLSAAPLAAAESLKLFVRRERAENGRNLVNQPEIGAWLAERGYVSVDPGTLSMEEQILLFGRASHVVGVEGAAMANIIFASQASEVTMLANPVAATEDFFPSIAKLATYRFRVLSGDPVALADPTVVPRSADFHMPIKRLAAQFECLV